MTNPDYTHLVLVVDRSGSMSSVQEEAQSGLTALLKEQFALPGRLTVTLAQFDTDFDTVVRMSDQPFEYVLEPRGMTALLDAVGMEIHRTGEDLGALPEHDRPSKVLFVVVTDGEENSSHEFTLERVREMVEHQRDVYSWAFQFIGADASAWQGHQLGMAAASNVGTKLGERSKYGMMNASMTAYRSAAPDAQFSMPEVIAEDAFATFGLDDTSPAVKKTAAKKTAAKKAPAKKTTAKKTVAKKNVTSKDS